MLFTSQVFLLLYLPAVLAGWWLLRGQAARLAFLTLASWFFYAWWDWRFVPLMVLTTGIDWLAGDRIAALADRAARRRWLVLALSANLALLGWFKYAGFFLETLNGLGAALGW